MERHRGGGGGDRYGNSPDTHRHFNSTKYSRGGPPYSSRSSSFSSSSYDDHHHHHYPHHRRSPSNVNINTSANNYRGGGGGARDYQRAFDSPPRYNPPPPSAGGPGGGAGDRGRGAGGGGFDSGYPMAPLPGQKRGYSYFDSRGSPKDRLDGGNFTKLFVGSVPRTATEEDIRPLFDDHGRVLEVALIRDKRTGQQQGCCFIKYATSEEADRAIRALHNQYTLPGGVGPIQVRYADGERERLGALEFKLFVGSLNKQATEREVEEIFAPYGQVEDVYLMRDDMRQSRGCGFVKYSHREMALAAINALNGIYTMQGCDQPLTVRFADPKRPRFGESRGGAPEYGGPGFAPRFPAPGIRPATNLGEPLHDRIPPNAWQPMSPQNLGPPYNTGLHGFGNRLPPTSGDIAATSAPGRILGNVSGNAERLLPGYAVSSTPMSQLNYNQSLPQVPSAGLQRSPLQKPLQSPQHLPLSLPQQPPNVASFVQPQTSHASLRPVSQVQMPNSSGHTPLNQALPSHQLAGLGGQLSVSQPQVPLNASPAIGQASRTSNLQPNFMSALANQQQLPAPVQLFQPPTQSPSQLAQLLAQQTQTLQATFQSSQQAFSQLQQQLQMMQPSNQSLMAQQGLQSSKQQSPWAGTVSQQVVNASAVQPGGDEAAAASANPTVPAMSRVGKCNWTEHTSPEGYKYYYNSTTGESKWEKPEELALYEQQQQQKPPVQQPQVQPHPQNLSVQNVPQKQILVQNQLQTQLQSQIRPQQLQQSSQSFPYQAPGVIGHQNVQELSYMHTPPVTGSKSMDDPAYYQQGHQPAQDWVWKNKPAGP